jgi:excisionase family DNA binding protein
MGTLLVTSWSRLLNLQLQAAAGPCRGHQLPVRGSRVDTAAMTTTSPSCLMTVTQVAERLGVSVATVRRATSAGHLPHHRLGARAVRYSEADLQAYLADTRVEWHRPRTRR